jgi:AraC-like DNA-binding protein
MPVPGDDLPLRSVGQDPHFTLSVNPLRMLAARLRARGADVSAMLVRRGIAADALDDLEGRVPVRAACELWDDAALVLHEPDVGLLVGSRAPIGEGVLAYAVQACQTLGDTWHLFIRFHRLIADVLEPRLVEERGRARLSLYTAVANPRLLYHLSDLYLAKIVFGGRLVTGVEWNPIAVHFRHQRPPQLDDYRRFFRAPLVFGHAVDELEVDSALLKLPLRGADPRLLHILDRYATEVLARLPPANDFVTALRCAVATSLQRQEPTLDRLAAHFHTSTRTLQRRLADAGLSLRRLIDDARYELALRYLERDDLSLAEVGFLLGFDGRQSFHRAFRRWTGATPAEMRRRLQQEAAARVRP